VKSQAKGKAIFVMFDDETERLCQAIDLDIALPPAALRTHLDSKIETTRIGKTRIGNMAGVASVPNVLGKANSLATVLTKSAKLGPKLVVQTPYGDSGPTAFSSAPRMTGRDTPLRSSSST
jgi:hypothetical protein